MSVPTMCAAVRQNVAYLKISSVDIEGITITSVLEMENGKRKVN